MSETIPETTLHLVKLPLRADKLVEIARRRGISLRDLDDGYLSHSILRELWQDKAPAPFVLRGRGRCVDAWGYTKADAASLVSHARDFGDPTLLSVFDNLQNIASKPMPSFRPRQRIGFHLRACPVVRLSGPSGGHRAGAEVDAYQAYRFRVSPDEAISREEIYRDWLGSKFREPNECGVTVERIAIAAFTREHFVRRNHEEIRKAKRIERPDVRFEGELLVSDGGKLLELLERGVGRHRAFGFGAMIVVPPGTPYPRDELRDNQRV